MATLRTTYAKLRQPLLALCLLAGGGAALGAGLAASLPWLPTAVQRPLLEGLGWVPGLHAGLEVSAEAPAGAGTLRADWTGRLAARFPATEEAWAQAGEPVRVFLPAILALAAWGTLVGLALHALWFLDSWRRPLLACLVVGVFGGLVVAHSLESFPSRWAPFWLRGLAGLPGIEERVGVPGVVADVEVGAGRYLASSGGKVATHPPESPPWSADARVDVPGRGRAWFAFYGFLLLVSIAAIAGALRSERWRLRVPGLGFGLGLFVWLLLPLLPSAVGRSWVQLMRPEHDASSLALGPLPLMEVGERIVSVELGLLALLVVGLTLALVPLGLVGAGLGAARRALARRRERRRQQAEARAQEPEWLELYEERRNGNGSSESAEPVGDPPEPATVAVAEEPNPAPEPPPEVFRPPTED